MIKINFVFGCVKIRTYYRQEKEKVVGGGFAEYYNQEKQLIEKTAPQDIIVMAPVRC